ncbi:hypothetical protein OAS39_11975 [Pirellulales bacterium]|nr:hypothetical protein [Pirellulales bacterium]
MFELKQIASEAVPAAMEKALRYRLLNEPLQAESICRDVLTVDPNNQQALVTLILSLTDQFDTDFAQSINGATELLPQLQGEYEREYYAGIINERWANAQVSRNVPGDVVYTWFQQALACYGRAEALSRPDDADAALRWNTCVRILQRSAHIRPSDRSMRRDLMAEFGDEMPVPEKKRSS